MATGDHDWTAGEQVTAANMDDYLQLQVVQQFATAAARDSALSARKREGMVTYQIDTNTLTVYSGAAWSTIGPVHGAWIGFTPVVTQNNAPTFTTNYARYRRVGRSVCAQYYLTLTASGTAANGVSVSVPFTAAQNFLTIGVGKILDTSASTTYPGIAQFSGSGQFVFLSSTSPGILGVSGSPFTAALATGDEIFATIEYEAAADA